MVESGITNATVADPWMYVSIIAVGIIVFGLRALIKGDLRSGREVEQNNTRMTEMERALRTRDQQVDEALRVLPEVASVLKKFHTAAQETKSEG
jgi:hypothetical protein